MSKSPTQTPVPITSLVRNDSSGMSDYPSPGSDDCASIGNCSPPSSVDSSFVPIHGEKIQMIKREALASGKVKYTFSIPDEDDKDIIISGERWRTIGKIKPRHSCFIAHYYTGGITTDIWKFPDCYRRFVYRDLEDVSYWLAIRIMDTELNSERIENEL